jgi:ABC-type uncharacterized transport system substrate-binding protein
MAPVSERRAAMASSTSVPILRRRVAIALTLLGAGAPVWARSPATSRSSRARVGFISPGAPGAGAPETFRNALARLGYVEGQNLIFEVRYARGKFDQVPSLTHELVENKVDLIAVIGAITVRQAKAEAGNTPLLFTIVVDPVEEHLVDDMHRPGANVTGVTNLDRQQQRNRLALLKEVLPSLTRVAVLSDAGVSDAQLKSAQSAAAAMGLQTSSFRIAAGEPRFDEVFSAISAQGAQALLVLEEPSLSVHRHKIAELARLAKLPSMLPPLSADIDAPLFYGTNLTKPIERMAELAARVLMGENPGDIAVETVVSYDLIVNQKSARELGLAIPETVLKRADRILAQ